MSVSFNKGQTFKKFSTTCVTTHGVQALKSAGTLHSMWRRAWNNLDMERSHTFRKGLPKEQVSWRSGLEWIWTNLVFTWEMMAFQIWNNWLVCCGNGYWLSNWRIPVFLSPLWLLHFIKKPVFYFLKSFIFHFLFLPGLHGMWDLNSLARVWTPAPCSGGAQS